MPQRIPLPYIPPKIDRADLRPNGKLMSDSDIRLLHQLSDGRYGKKRLKQLTGIDFPFAVQKTGDQLLAIYKGRKILPGETEGKELGEGSYGVAKLGQDLGTGVFTVFKVIAITSEAVKKQTDEEIAQLEKFNLLTNKPVTYISYEQKYQGYVPKTLVGMKLAEGQQLWKLVSPFTPEGQVNPLDNFNPLQRFMMAKSLLKSTKDAHVKGVLHRDIKPDNFVCNPGTCEVKLIDFGMAKNAIKVFAKTAKSLSEKIGALVRKPGKKSDLVLEDKEILGTPTYMAPEIINKQPKVYNEATEVYALGQTIADVFGLTTPDDSIIFFRNNKPIVLDRQKVVDEKHPQFQINVNDRLPRDPASRKELLTLLQNMTDKDPKKRPSLNDAYRKINELLAKEFDQEFKVGIIQVEDFAQLNAYQQRQLINEMKAQGITAVALGHATSGQPNLDIYQQVRQVLTDNNFLNVVPLAFTDPSKQLLQQDAVQYFQSHFQAKPTVYEITNNVKQINVTAPVQTASVSKVETPKMETTASDQVKTPTMATTETRSANIVLPNAPQEPWVKAKTTVAPASHAATFFSAQRSGSSANNQLTVEQQIQQLPIYKGTMDTAGAKVVLEQQSVGAYLLRYSPEKKDYFITVKLNERNHVFSLPMNKQDMEDFLNGKQSEVIQKFAKSLGRPENFLQEMQSSASKPIPVR